MSDKLPDAEERRLMETMTEAFQEMGKSRLSELVVKPLRTEELRIFISRDRLNEMETVLLGDHCKACLGGYDRMSLLGLVYAARKFGFLLHEDNDD